MRHCRRRGLGLRLLSGQPARPPAPRSLPSSDHLQLAFPPLGFKVTPSGRLGLGKSPAESAREKSESGGGGAGRPAGWVKTACRPGCTCSEKETGFRAQLAETRGGPRPLTWITCTWKLFRKIYFTPGVFFLKAPPVILIICLEKNRAFPPRLSCPEHRSKPGLKKFPCEKLQIILNY